MIATASLVGGIFGKGGGGEVSNAEIYSAARARFGKVRGVKVWRDLRRANDPEAPTTVEGRSFPYQQRKPKRVNRKAVAMPDPGSLVPGSPDDATPAGSAAAAASASGGEARSSALDTGGPGEAPSTGILSGLSDLEGGSNALLVSGRESASGHPLAVFGPQVSYYSPQILMEEDLHAPDFDARGTAFVGVNLFVLLGRGQDYAWSATSAGQDIIDTFAERLCEPGGGKPTINSMHYLWKGQCRPIEVLERVNQITPNASDPSPAETYRLEAQRTIHGVISERGRVNGIPVAFARLRSTYFHEADSALGFSKFNTPSQVSNAREFQEAADDIGFTFNWFYADDRDIGYYNSGFNPVRAKGTDPEFPMWGTGKYDWQGWDAGGERLAPDLLRRPPPGHQPGLHHELEQQAGARLRGVRGHLLVRFDPPLAVPRRADRGGDRRQAQAEPRRADRRDGGRRHRRPARKPGPAVDARGALQGGRARRPARRGRSALRMDPLRALTAVTAIETASTRTRGRSP